MRLGDRVTFEQLVIAVGTVGPLCIEFVRCNHCKRVEVAIHPFMESFPCEWCGKRNASRVRIYAARPKLTWKDRLIRRFRYYRARLLR